MSTRTKKSWTLFFTIPWIFISLLTIISLVITNSNIDTNNIFTYLIAFFAILILIALPYSMLVTAPLKPHLYTIAYMAFIWIVLKLINFKNLSIITSFDAGLISGIICTIIAMSIFHLRTKKLRVS